MVVSTLLASLLAVGCGSLTTASDTGCLPSPLRLSTTRVQPGRTLTVSSTPFVCGTRYPSGKTYTLTFGQVGRGALLRLGAVPVHRNGGFTAIVQIPSNASPGQAFIMVKGSSFDRCRDKSESCAGYTARLQVLGPA